MRKLLLLAAFLLLSFTQPARAQFCPGVSPWVFDDVAASDPFCSYITWMAENGITLGCVTIDANHRLYCPNANVTRAAMAAFMNRLGNVRVEAVDTGPGLTGGPITSVGTINLATTQLLPTTACATNQIPKWNGTAWACANDASGTGTVTSVASGTGLTGGPITGSGTLSIATGYQLPQGCTNGQVAKSSGSNAWTCANDVNSGGTVTSITAGSGLTGGTITTAGTIAVDPASATLTTNFFKQNGNAFGTTAALGTTDNNPIDIRANNARVMRYEPNAISPNVIGGSPANNVTAGVRGATIAGGGVPSGNTDPDFVNAGPNRVTDAYGTVGGGWANRAGDDAGTTVDQPFATVGGGYVNIASGARSTVGGGAGNTASGVNSTVGGGVSNTASGLGSVVGGGLANVASGVRSFVGGGGSNTASGNLSSVAGGFFNSAIGDSSVAMGNRAKAIGSGTFAFADGQPFDYPASADNQFVVRATGGAYFVTQIDAFSGAPTRTVGVNGNGEMDFGSQTRQMINLWGPAAYGLGVQTETLYGRSNNNFAWFRGGVHADGMYDAGSGGSVLATLQTGASATTVTGTFRALAFTATSDRDQKIDMAPTNSADILERVLSMPISTWAYKAEREAGFRHIGPTAQDFRERFGVGYDDKSIATVDADGVALAAIQGLNAKLTAANAKLESAIVQRDARIDAQAREIADLKAAHAADIAELRRAVEVLLARTSPEGRVAAK